MKRNKKILIVFIILALGLIVGFIVIRIINLESELNKTSSKVISYPTSYTYNLDSKISSLSPNITNQNYNKPNSSLSGSFMLTTKQFQGKYVSATLPNEWTIKEYSNSDGFQDINSIYSSYKASNPEGLTGLQIFGNRNVPFFKIAGSGGVGGTSGCSTLDLFKDTDAHYIQKIMNDNTAFIPALKLNIIDLGNSKYSDIYFLNIHLRRISNTLYASIDNTLGKFNTSCGSSQSFITIPGLSFTNDSYSFSTYYYGINKSIAINDEDLNKLDTVLNSINVK